MKTSATPFQKKIRHLLAILVILLISIAVGFTYNGVLTLFERASHPRKYENLVSLYAETYAVPESVVYAVIKCESNFNASAVSDAGAIGLMQLMPETYEWLCAYHLHETYEPGLLYEPATNIRFGTYLLSFLYLRYGNWETAFAAYNAGIGNVDEWLQNPDYIDGSGLLKTIPFRETAEYVKKVSKNRSVYQRLYGDFQETESNIKE